ncbi:hypothetical protein SISNIDRAFT_471676 [Sistotremastrum niveocremeum HHB9708]|uniref:Uncharacterized protein n=1 Tax=Sistotremastrum niveocremeum HHB9708 TaxID=1314777 RepID=A0A164MCT3_9AGAM|nr:hypothetical protein SISNIDRAFT_471676 [Sistotremastrum niveocremeum HHB9708]
MNSASMVMTQVSRLRKSGTGGPLEADNDVTWSKDLRVAALNQVMKDALTHLSQPSQGLRNAADVASSTCPTAAVPRASTEDHKPYPNFASEYVLGSPQEDGRHGSVSPLEESSCPTEPSGYPITGNKPRFSLRSDEAVDDSPHGAVNQSPQSKRSDGPYAPSQSESSLGMEVDYPITPNTLTSQRSHHYLSHPNSHPMRLHGELPVDGQPPVAETSTERPVQEDPPPNMFPPHGPNKVNSVLGEFQVSR